MDFMVLINYLLGIDPRIVGTIFFLSMALLSMLMRGCGGGITYGVAFFITLTVAVVSLMLLLQAGGQP